MYSWYNKHEHQLKGKHYKYYIMKFKNEFIHKMYVITGMENSRTLYNGYMLKVYVWHVPNGLILIHSAHFIALLDSIPSSTTIFLESVEPFSFEGYLIFVWICKLFICVYCIFYVQTWLRLLQYLFHKRHNKFYWEFLKDLRLFYKDACYIH